MAFFHPWERWPLITCRNGDIAEQAAIPQGLRRGWGVRRPIGDSLPYDLLYDVEGALIRIQVNLAWLDQNEGNLVVDNQRIHANRRQMLRAPYTSRDFDAALAYLEDLDLLYVFPGDVFIGYGSEIHLVETDKRQRPALLSGPGGSTRSEWNRSHRRKRASVLSPRRS